MKHIHSPCVDCLFRIIRKTEKEKKNSNLIIRNGQKNVSKSLSVKLQIYSNIHGLNTSLLVLNSEVNCA